MRTLPVTVLAAIAIGALQAPASAQDDPQPMTFFITSAGPGNGADLGGLEGADRHCQSLAASVDAGDHVWRAYLSATSEDGESAVNARDRIGPGPWHNQQGVLIARDAAELHSPEANLTKETILTEAGAMVNGRGDDPNQHDILTGSTLEGMAFDTDEDTTCSDWTSSGEGSARVGHHDRTGGGEHPESWNSAHGSRGCSQENLQSTGGNGYFYCFAAGPAGDGGDSRPED
jgi:hypothetical protein